jgi:hypothetical protein
MTHIRKAALGGAIVLLTAGAAHAQPPAPKNECFFVRQFENWKPGGDEKTIYIRVAGNRYYRLGTANRCPVLSDVDPVMVNKFRSDTICSPLDFDMKLKRNGVPDIATACTIRTMTRMTPAEVAALPARQKP